MQPPPLKDWMFLGKLSEKTSLKVIHANVSSRFIHISKASTSAVLSLDEDVSLSVEEIQFAYEVWKQFENRIVGFPSRNHYWDDQNRLWVYSSAMTNEFSMILTSAAFIHRKHARLFTEYLSVSLTSAVETYPECQHILINFLIR